LSLNCICSKEVRRAAATHLYFRANKQSSRKLLAALFSNMLNIQVQVPML